MDQYSIVDGPSGDEILKVTTGDMGVVTEASPSDNPDMAWAVDAVNEMIGMGQYTLSQVVRYFGRNAEAQTTEDFMASKRVTKRGTENEGEVSLHADGAILKTDPDQRIVFGWAYVVKDASGNQVVDKSGDFIDAVEEIEKSAYNYVLSSRASDADHTNVKGGTLVESIVFTPEKIEKMGLPAGSIPLGWWVGYKIEDEPTWQRVKKGELVAFSIHGSGTRTKWAPGSE